MIRRTVFLLAFAATVAACQPPGSPAASPLDAEAKRFEAAPGMAAIYVVRGPDSFMLAGVSARVNDQAPVSIGRRDYARFDVSPGVNRVICGEGDTSFVVNVAAGQIAFIEAIVSTGMASQRCVLVPVDDLNGRDRVSAGQRVAPRG